MYRLYILLISNKLNNALLLYETNPKLLYIIQYITFSYLSSTQNLTLEVTSHFVIPFFQGASYLSQRVSLELYNTDDTQQYYHFAFQPFYVF